jgi:hypothetical protein
MPGDDGNHLMSGLVVQAIASVVGQISASSVGTNSNLGQQEPEAL